MKRDEHIFFPSLGTPTPDGGWQVDVHAWCFRMRPRRIVVPLFRKLLVRTPTGAERVRLTSAQQAICRGRARWMFVDNKRGRTLSVCVDGEVRPLGKTRANGHVRARIAVKRPAIPGLEIHCLEREGLSVISDIDDTIRISHVHDRAALLRGTFLEPFRPVPEMADVYRGWARQHGAQFHYLSATPWQLYVPIAEFIKTNGFPAGTFHLKHFRWRDRTFFGLFASPDRYKLRAIEPLLERLPHRRFVLVGDSGQRDPEVFGELARRYRRQVRRIFIRDVAGSGDAPRYRAAFADLSPESWSVFTDPATLPRVLQPSKT